MTTYGLGVDMPTGMALNNGMSTNERPTHSIRADKVRFGMDIYDAGLTRTVAEVHTNYGPGNGRSGTASIVWVDGEVDHYPADYRLYEVR